MSEGNSTKSIEEIYKKPLIEIFLFENMQKNIIKEIDSDDSKSKEEKEKLKTEYREKEKKIKIQKDMLEKYINTLDYARFVEFIHVLQEIYVETKDYKPLVKKFLTGRVIGLKVKNFRKKNFASSYELVEFISNKFPVDDYPLLTIKSRAPLYGAIVNKTAKSQTVLTPLTKDEIINCLDVFADKNATVFYNWVMAILGFDPSLMVQGLEERYLIERQELILWLIDKTKKDIKYQRTISQKLFERGDLARLVNLEVSGLKDKSRIKELEEKIVAIETESAAKEASYRDRAGKQKEIIDEKQKAIDFLRVEVKNYDEMSNKLSRYIEKYNAQVSMNERITIENDIRVHEVEELLKSTTEDNERLLIELNSTKTVLENIQSDLSLRMAEIKRLNESISAVEDNIKEKVLHELVNALKDQWYYISMFYLEVLEHGTLESESIEMFGDTIQNINESFSSIGVEVFGNIDEIVEFDSAIHDSMGYKMSNGDKAILRVPGWKIDGTVYSKAQVEKEN